MIEIVLALSVLVLAAGVILSYAMVGELAARFEESVLGNSVRSFVRPLQNAPINKYPRSWATALTAISRARRGALLVFSTSCISCERLAPSLPAAIQSFPIREVALAIASPRRELAESFIERHQLQLVRHWIDDAGKWLRDDVGVTTSPVCLVFDAGLLTAALSFSDFPILADAISKTDSLPLGQR